MQDDNSIVVKVEMTAYALNWDVYIKESRLVSVRKDFSNVNRNMSEGVNALLREVKKAVDDDNKISKPTKTSSDNSND